MSSQQLSLRSRLLVVFPLTAFLVATTKWVPWSEPIRLRFAGDVDNYERIARAAPHFTWPQTEGHVGMWAVHYFVGLVAKTTHIPLHIVYYVFAVGVLSLTVVIVDRILRDLRVDLATYAISMAALLLNPYVFRYLALAPGMLNDSVFIASLSLIVLGILRGRTGLVYLAVALAAISRDLSLPPIMVGTAIWLAFFPPLPGVARRKRISTAAGAIVVPTVAWVIVYWLGTTAPGHAKPVNGCCSLATLTIWGDISKLPSSGGTLGLHFLRSAIGLAMPLALLAALAIGSALARKRRPLPPTFWGALTVSGLMIAQILLVASSSNNGAEPRLTALAVVPVVVVVAVLLSTRPLADPMVATLARWQVCALVLIFGLASLHHHFATFGARTSTEFAALECMCAVAVVAVIAAPKLRPVLQARQDAQRAARLPVR